MGSQQHQTAPRLAAVLLALSLLAACGGDRSRAAGGADTTGAAVTPDSAAMPTSDSGVPRDTAMAPAADTAARTSSAATDTTAKRPAATPAPAKKPVAIAPKTATDTAAAPQGQDTSRPSSANAGTELRDEYHKAPRDTVTQAVYDGWKQFNLNCARCHGEDVLGTTIAPHLIVSLKPDGPINSKELFVQTVCAGRPAKGMPSWCALGLGMDKINEIYEYVKGRSDAKIGPGRPAVKQQG